jgi:hypothetical protein
MRISRLSAPLLALALTACAASQAGNGELPTVTQSAPTAVIAPAQPTPAASPTVEPAAPTPTSEQAASPAPTPQPSETPAAAVALLSGAFVKGEVAVQGSYTLDPVAGVLRLSDDFHVAPGPDLFVILSGAGDLTLDFHAFSQLVTQSAKLTLGPLASPSGAQTYNIPPGAGLAAFKTVVIWCETYSVEFAAAPLNP